MPNEDMDDRSSPVEEEQAVSVTDEKKEEAPLEQDKSSDHVGVNLDNNPETQLFHRRSSSFKLNGQSRETKEPSIDNSGHALATLDVAELQMAGLGHTNKLDVLKDEKGLGKGVVLNAVQLYRPRDVRWSGDPLGKENTKDHELTLSYIVSGNQVTDSSVDKRELDQIPEELKQGMTPMRKFVFGVSFIPSVLFVLCFAVILPCNQRDLSLCTEELWLTTVNASDISTDLGVAHRILLVSFEDPNEILSLSMETGTEVWSLPSEAPIIQIECDKIDINGDGADDCLVMMESRSIYAYNASNGNLIWKHYFSEEKVSNFITMAGYDADARSQAVAVAISSSEIQSLSNGSLKSNCQTIIPNCRTTPKRLTAWNHNNVTDLVFICEAEFGNDTLQLLKHENLCSKNKTKTLELLNSDEVDLNNIRLKPVPNGLVVWAGDIVTLFNNGGEKTWQTVVRSHSNNRYLLYGNFFPNEENIALISGDPTTQSLLTLMYLESGNVSFSYFFSLADTKNALALSGGDQDYILILLEEMEKAGEGEGIASLNEITTPTIYPPAEIFNLPKSKTSNYRLSLLQFHAPDGKKSLREGRIEQEILREKEKEELWNQEETVRLSAVTEGDRLNIYLGRSFITLSGKLSVIQALRVNNWNKTSTGLSLCK